METAINKALNKALHRDRAIVLAAIIMISLLAWAYTLWLAGQLSLMDMPAAVPTSAGMAGMDGMNMSGEGVAHTTDSASDVAPGGVMELAGPAFRPWGVSDFAFTFVMWAVMMGGMMTPSVAPMLLLYAAVGRKAAANGRPLAATSWFLAGYLSAWSAFSLVATGAQFMLTWLALLVPMMALASGVLGALVLIGAGLYQWSPLKDLCVTQCQSPIGFLMSHGGFRSHWSGALRLGAQHGIYCVGCCWLVMTLLFVGGVMNVLWIAGLALLVLAEKVVLAGLLIPRLAGAGMIAAGFFVLSQAV
jgi:predicted metal-binding membrane protein